LADQRLSTFRPSTFNLQRRLSEAPVLWTITIILFVLWVLGMVSGAQLGMWVHLLLVFALISLVLSVVRRTPAT
jgi:hypothetical protein